MSNHSYIGLPTDKEKLAKVVWATARREELASNYRHLRWWLAYSYVALGARRFDIFDPQTRQFRWSAFDEEGNMEFQSQDMLSLITKNLGRLESMNLEPFVTTEGFTLASMRERAMAQVIGDSVVGMSQVRDRQKAFCLILLMLGACGIGSDVVDHNALGLTADLEVVHPQEVFAFPSLGRDYTKVCGKQRIRWVPLQWLADRVGGQVKREENKKKMCVVTRRPGISLEEENPAHNDPSSFYDGKHMGQEGGEEEAVKIVELWTDGPRGTNEYYTVVSGDYTIAHFDYRGKERYCPLGWARCLENGTFHGAGVFDLCFPICRQLEQLEKSLYNNIRDTDKYGIVVLPQGQINKNQVLEDVGYGLRALFWQPDAMSESFSPFSIQPFNLRDLPGKVAQFARERIQDMNPLRDLLDEKGRVDSAQGLQIIDEKINQGMTTATSSIQSAWGAAYREAVRKSSEMMVTSQRALPVNRLTLDLVGVKLDRLRGTVQFGVNPLPSISRLTFGVREVNPRSRVARKMEAIQMYQLAQPEGSYRLQDLVLFCLEEGLDLAVWSEPQKAARETIVADIIELFGDGMEPGEVKIAEYTVLPEVQLAILSGFMSRPIMRLASTEVKAAFKEYRDSLVEWITGMVLPTGVPNLEDQALLNSEAQPPALPPPEAPQPSFQGDFE